MNARTDTSSRALSLTRAAEGDLSELAGKYAEIVRLRLEHAAGDATDPRPSLARLAARFPGALREIDALPLAVLTARHDALLRAAEDPAAHAPWMSATIHFHRLARGALGAKRWLRGKKQVDAPLRAAFEEALVAGTLDRDASAWSERLQEVAAPPRGRITALVLARLAEELAVSVESARALIFGGG